MSRQTIAKCDCCDETVGNAEQDLRQFKAIIDLGSAWRNIASCHRGREGSPDAFNQFKVYDLCTDCLQFITGESIHGSQDKLPKALTHLLFEFMLNGMKNENKRGREAKPKTEQKPNPYYPEGGGS